MMNAKRLKLMNFLKSLSKYQQIFSYQTTENSVVFEDHDQISRSVAFKPDNIASAVNWFRSYRI